MYEYGTHEWCSNQTPPPASTRTTGSNKSSFGGGEGGGGGGGEGWDCLSVLPSLSSRDVSVSPVVTAQHVANVVVHRAERHVIDKLH